MRNICGWVEPQTQTTASSTAARATVLTSIVTLLFTPSNWDTPQIVTVHGQDDPVEDGDVAYTIVTAAATSADAAYSGLDAADVSVTNLDNDAAPSQLSIAGISPASMQRGTTVSVTITGTGFEPGTTVAFENFAGATPTAVITSMTPTQITADVTVGTSGPKRDRVGDVRVTLPGGASDVLVGGFTVTIEASATATAESIASGPTSLLGLPMEEEESPVFSI